VSARLGVCPIPRRPPRCVLAVADVTRRGPDTTVYKPASTVSLAIRSMPPAVYAAPRCGSGRFDHRRVSEILNSGPATGPITIRVIIVLAAPDRIRTRAGGGCSNDGAVADATMTATRSGWTCKPGLPRDGAGPVAVVAAQLLSKGPRLEEAGVGRPTLLSHLKRRPLVVACATAP